MPLLSHLLLLALTASIVMSAAANAETPRVFSGKSTLLVVSGYSTSSVWPHILQRKLDRYHDGERIIEVRSAVIASTPIAKLMDVRTGRPKESWRRIEEAIASGGDRPVVVLAQQSLQWSFGPRRRTGIRNSDDKERIRVGSSVLRKYHELLLRTGADQVVLATHVYKKAMEPEIYNERYALDELARENPQAFTAGPDVWTVTRNNYPLAYERDRVHLSSFGAEAVAQEWFEFLLQREGASIPDWSREQVAAAQELAIAQRKKIKAQETSKRNKFARPRQDGR
ncbi:hypothetical protein K1W69_12580 [Hoeflea sp. WL0058]|uniref:SGNH/GDSL hydrolase family protein n=1 Tax=Flavimaribacter sediminis TaxID=2865987 RepID=A0AAE2ZL31_9HYPH|nr:hypothetical protein [Flavimaribacter sediminis]MBW8638024.1 hypothetical protein [Flavimaribacter sediminis]